MQVCVSFQCEQTIIQLTLKSFLTKNAEPEPSMQRLKQASQSDDSDYDEFE